MMIDNVRDRNACQKYFSFKIFRSPLKSYSGIDYILHSSIAHVDYVRYRLCSFRWEIGGVEWVGVGKS